jgi:hypothetical protein
MNTTCLLCDKPLPKRRRKYCSDECSNLYFVHFIGPLWWNSAKAAALRRAVNRCEHIDSFGIRCETTVRLEVHHIEPLGKYEGYHNNPKNKLENLQVLCRPHHEDAHRKHFTSKHPAKEQLIMELNV